MACQSCQPSHVSYFQPDLNKGACCDCGCVDASKVNYTGPNLVCTEIEANTKVQDILLKFDERLCEVTDSNWATFNYACLDDTTPITSASQFVETISEEFCSLRDSYSTFTTVSYPSQVLALQTQIDSIINPEITSSSFIGIGVADTYTTVFNKINTAIDNLNTTQNVSSANWNECFTVTPVPTTIVEGFNTVISQICSLSTPPTVTLPTFNNVGSCLPAPLTTADSLVSTINKIKTKLCQTGSFDIDSVTWGCIGNPAPSTGPNIQAAINEIANEVNTLIAAKPTFNPDHFDITSDGCNGQEINLNTLALGVDRFVATDDADTTPGTLIDKIVGAGTITVDNTTNPNQITITGTNTDNLVRVNGSDTTSGYLADKVESIGSNGLYLTVVANPSNSKLRINPQINPVDLINYLFDTIESDTELYERWCTLNCGCAPCQENNTPQPQARRIKLRVNNNQGVQINNKYTITQNSPTLNFIENNIIVAPSDTYDSGWYDTTSTNTSLSALLNIQNTGAVAQTLNITVKNTSGTIISGTSSYIGAIGNAYNNPNFQLGNLQTDLIIEVNIN